MGEFEMPHYYYNAPGEVIRRFRNARCPPPAINSRKATPPPLVAGRSPPASCESKPNSASALGGNPVAILRFVEHHGLADSDGAAVCRAAVEPTSAYRSCHCSRSVSGNFASSPGSWTLVKAGSTCHVESGGAASSFIHWVMNRRSARRN